MQHIERHTHSTYTHHQLTLISLLLAHDLHITHMCAHTNCTPSVTLQAGGRDTTNHMHDSTYTLQPQGHIELSVCESASDVTHTSLLVDDAGTP